MRNLKRTLDRFYREYDFQKRLSHDPIAFPHRYADPEDIEIAGFIASCFAYGKVDLFTPVIQKILEPGGRHPAQFFASFDVKRHSSLFSGVSYRFNREDDVTCLIYLLSRSLKEWGSLRNLFYHHYKEDDEDIRPALAGFNGYYLEIDTSPIYGKNIKPLGLKQLFPDPGSGSACKRINLFLRWMVRKKDIDFGIWDKILPSRLIIPLDTHIAKISKCLGLTKRKSSDWNTAREITESLKGIDPDDPLKYDFALCHQGIAGLCNGRKGLESCSSCAFY